MRITVKSIIKWGLIAEIITAIVGQVGEFALRYRAYSSAFDELFGRYRLQDNVGTEEFELDPRIVTSSPVKLQPFQIDPNHQRYDHRSGRNFPFPNAPRDSASSTVKSPSGPITLQSVTNSTEKSHLTTIMNSIFRPSISAKSKSESAMFNFDSYSSSVTDMLSIPKSLDPRPLLVCAILVCLNVLFIIGIAYEYLPLICPLTIVWLLYLILVLLILHAGTSPSSTSSISLSQSPWTTLTPSPFTILVVSIILVFSLIFTAIIVEERRQIAIRIRAKSAAIPLVKSRDMDLDEI